MCLPPQGATSETTAGYACGGNSPMVSEPGVPPIHRGDQKRGSALKRQDSGRANGQEVVPPPLKEEGPEEMSSVVLRIASGA